MPDSITILTIAIYYILIFVRGTRGWPVVIGFVLMLVLSFVSDLLKLQVLALFLQTFFAASAFAALVIFQPELRRMLAGKKKCCASFRRWKCRQRCR